jgi:acetyl-CoA synthetase
MDDPPGANGLAGLRARVDTLISKYSDAKVSAALLLCDGYDSAAVAYRIVAADLSSTELSYGALREESERLAAGMWSLGIRPGDRVATLMGKSRAYLVTLMAIWRLGAVHVPLFTAFAPPAIALRLRASGCRLIACDAGQMHKLAPGADMPVNPPWRVVTTANPDSDSLAYADLLAGFQSGFPAAALGGDAPLIQIFTSGTTGKPKGVVVPVRGLASFQAYAEFALDLRRDDVFWNSADPGWAYGLYFGVIATFATGVTSLLLEGGFSAETTFAILSRYGVTNFGAAPTVYRSLRASGLKPTDASKLRCASSAGEPLTPEINDWARTVLGVAVHDHYGQTETGMIINNHHHPALKRPLKQGSMGVAMPGLSAAVLQPERDEPASPDTLGRVAIDLANSPLAWFKGYVGEPTKTTEKFSADGRWYLTGDLGHVDEDGNFYFASREDDIILMAGYRIGPVEVESVLTAHPAVAECAAIAVPDELRGEVLEAVVVLSADRAPSDRLTTELQHWVKERFAAHAYPRRVHYVESLPKTPSGKVQRFVLRQQYATAGAAESRPRA